MRVVIEADSLEPLLREDHLEKLSEVVGVRLCRPQDLEDEGGRLTLLEAEPLAVSVGIAAMKKKGETGASLFGNVGGIPAPEFREEDLRVFDRYLRELNARAAAEQAGNSAAGPDLHKQKQVLDEDGTC